MLDAALRRLIDPPLDRAARVLARHPRLSADAVSWTGFACGAAAAVAIATGAFFSGFLLFLANRLADGLDGAFARLRGPTDRGGFLDIVLDFLIYAAIPLGFAIAAPEENALAAAVLLFSFVGTGSSFLAYSVIAAKRGLSSEIRGKKSIYYLGGLAEGSETVLVLGLMCLWPAGFVPLAWIFAVICWITTATRIYAGVRTFD